MVPNPKLRPLHLVALAFLAPAIFAPTAYGASGAAGFDTPRGRRSGNPSDWTQSFPSEEMSDRAAELVSRESSSGIEFTECEPAESMDGSGEYNFLGALSVAERTGAPEVSARVAALNDELAQ